MPGNNETDGGPPERGITRSSAAAVALLLAASLGMMAIARRERAEPSTPTGGEEEADASTQAAPTIVRMAPGERLLDVGWKCPDNEPCVLWTLTRELGPGEHPSSYALAHGDEVIRLVETGRAGPDGGG